MENPTNNTTTPQMPKFLWVEEPNVRGTSGILTFCVSTLIICVWSALHFDIPQRRHTNTERLAFGILWIIVGVLCPEGLLTSALFQRIDASILEGYASLYLQSETQAKPGWLTRTLKRFVLKAGGKSGELELNSMRPPSGNRQCPFGLVYAFYATMGGFAFDIPKKSGASKTSTTSSTRRYVLTSQGFLYIMQNFPDIIPDISEESITDRSESSPLSKALLIVQVGWFCANCLARLILHLPLSLLEVSTVAHGFCTLLTYFILWSKPQNIAEATPINGPRARQVLALLRCTEKEYATALKMAPTAVAGPTDSNDQIVLAAHALRHRLPGHGALPPGRDDSFHIPFWSSSPGSPYCHLCPPNAFLYQMIPLVIAPLLYGLPHFLGWSELFPSPLERLFWRVSTFMATGSGVPFVLLVLLGNQYNHSIGRIGLGLTSILYIVASGFLIGESLRQLFYLDPGTYQLVPWSNYWPHFS